MPLSPSQVHHILDTLVSFGSSLTELNISVLQNQYCDYAASAPPLHEVPTLLDALQKYPPYRETVDRWMHNRVVAKLSAEIVALARKSSGWHFGASKAQLEQLESFDLLHMVQQMRTLAPNTCDLISHLLEADIEANEGREARRLTRISKMKHDQVFTRKRRVADENTRRDEANGSEPVDTENIDNEADDRSDCSDDRWAQLGGVYEDEEEEDRPSHLRQRGLTIVRV